MSTFVFPRDLSDKARKLLSLTFTVIGDDGEVPLTGEPPSAMPTLCKLLERHRQSVWAALEDLERFGLVERRYVREKIPSPPKTPPRFATTLRVRVLLANLHVEGACVSCGSPARGTGRWCARCKQVEGRDDRAWQLKALELHDEGLSPRRIAVRLDVPLFVASADDGRNPNGGAVVPFLLGKGLLGPEWAERLRDARRGASVED